jgi:hypothetical protein
MMTGCALAIVGALVVGATLGVTIFAILAMSRTSEKR